MINYYSLMFSTVNVLLIVIFKQCVSLFGIFFLLITAINTLTNARKPYVTGFNRNTNGCMFKHIKKFLNIQ
jgi:hypothetical protein